jgi:ADP-ribose pyrophosphatase
MEINDTDLIEKTISSESIYNGQIINVFRDKVELPNGKSSYREVVRHNGAVCVAAITEENELLFVRQFRYPFKEILLELPAGKFDRKDEDPLDCAKRELFEETGAVGRDYKYLGKIYTSPGFCDEIIHLYSCRVESVGESRPDEDEFLDVLQIQFDDAVSMIIDGKILDPKTITAITMLKIKNEIT